SGDVKLVINTPEGSGPQLDSRSIRLVANELGVPTYTTVAAAAAAVESLQMFKKDGGRSMGVCALQDYHQELYAN
ncbi:MAG: hypothetical protein OXT67_00215, partial [Zetaproteobacteria bacterium]|nr:hypothetical protein [Zetaproteobacteria bacterium]